MKFEEMDAKLIHAVLNSLYGIFAIEAVGFGRGLGVLDASSTRLKKMFMIDIKNISAQDAEEIISLFEKIKNRDVMDIEDELRDTDRSKFDKKVLQSLGVPEVYDNIKEAIISLQDTRHCIK